MMIFTHENVRRWFAEMRRLGDWPETACGKIEADGSIKWKYFSHEDYDGIGAIVQILRENGFDVPSTPETRRSRAKSAWWGLKQFTKPPLTVLDSQPPWKDYDRDFAGERVVPQAICLSRQDTQRIASNAKRQKVFPNSFQLWALDRAISPLLVNEWAPRHWMIPVNLRGPVQWKRDTANHSSGMWCRIKPGYSPADVQRTTLAQLKTDEHWVIWWQFQWIGLFGGHAVRQALLASKRGGNYTTATFVSVGDFSPKKLDGSDPDLWCAAPCAMRNSAISAGAGSFQGRQILALGVNPAVKDARLRAAETLERWRQLLMEDQ